MRLSPRLAAVSALLVGSAAHAQEGGFALNQLDLAPPGDALLAVQAPAPASAGFGVHLGGDYIHSPIRLKGDDRALVSGQTTLRLGASYGLAERLVLSLEVPAVVAQGGDDPGTAGISFTAPEAGLADVRLGVRALLLGEAGGAFQLGLGAYAFLPTGAAEHYTGDGGFRLAPQLVLGGQTGATSGLRWGLNAGARALGENTPTTVTVAAGAHLLLAEGALGVGPELLLALPTESEVSLSASPAAVTAQSGAQAEVLLAGRYRAASGLSVGVAAGPGLTSAVGNPVFRVLAVVGWAARAGAVAAGPGAADAKADTDDDGIEDSLDACPRQPGEPSADPARDGCPPPDRDEDGIVDAEDACPGQAGELHEEATRNGCPADGDADGVADAADACPTEEGEPAEDPKRNGCPQDADADGVTDSRDACPAKAGPRHAERSKSGCPADPDQDGIEYAADACPEVAGVSSATAARNGCPAVAGGAATAPGPTGEMLPERLLFQTRADGLGGLVTESRAVLEQVRAWLAAHPEIVRLEIQGHTDDEGGDDTNQRLSEKRAEAVRGWLVSKGIAAERLVVRGYGFERPAGDNRVKTGRQANRRVEFMVLERR